MEGNARTKDSLQYVLEMIVYYEVILSYSNLQLALEGKSVIISIIKVPRYVIYSIMSNKHTNVMWLVF